MAETRTPLVEMREISIAFGGIKAVEGASVDLYPGRSWACSAITARANRR